MFCNFLVCKVWQQQQGVIGPFMLGLLMTTTVLSYVSMEYARQKVLKLQAAKQERQALEVQDAAKALEFSLRREDAANFEYGTTEEDIRRNMAMGNARMDSGDRFEVTSRRTEKLFGLEQERIAIAATDDPLTRQRMNAATSGQDISQLPEALQQGNTAIAIVDTSAIRTQQIKKTRDRMETMAGQMYLFFGNNLRFPSDSEYEKLAEKLPSSNVWGTPFIYTRISEERATLEFTTPWHYTQTIELDMRKQ